MGWRLLLVALLACCGGGSGTVVDGGDDAPLAGGGSGTVAMAASGTGDIVAIDVETNIKTTLDPGTFGDVAISPDGAYVAYIGLDKIPKVVDRSGHVTHLETSSTGVTDGPRWGPHGTLTYLVARSSEGGIALVTHVGATPRVLGALAVVSPDGTQVAYHSADGLVCEDLDGSNHRVIASGVALIYQIDFTPDMTGLVVYERSMDGSLHLALYSLADNSRRELATLQYSPAAFPGLSRFSPDGRHVLFVTSETIPTLQEVDLDTAALRPLATLDTVVLNGADVQLEVGYVDASRIVYSRYHDFKTVSGTYSGVLHVTDGQTDHAIATAPGQNKPCRVEAADLPHGRLGVACGSTSLVDLGGASVVQHSGLTVLGISKDGQAMVVVEADGTLSFVPGSGTAQILGVAQNPRAQASAPFDRGYASYAP